MAILALRYDAGNSPEQHSTGHADSAELFGVSLRLTTQGHIANCCGQNSCNPEIEFSCRMLKGWVYELVQLSNPQILLWHCDPGHNLDTQSPDHSPTLETMLISTFGLGCVGPLTGIGQNKMELTITHCLRQMGCP